MEQLSYWLTIALSVVVVLLAVYSLYTSRTRMNLVIVAIMMIIGSVFTYVHGVMLGMPVYFLSVSLCIIMLFVMTLITEFKERKMELELVDLIVYIPVVLVTGGLLFMAQMNGGDIEKRLISEKITPDIILVLIVFVFAGLISLNVLTRSGRK